DRPRHVPRDRRGAAPRARRRQVSAVSAAAPIRRRGLARQEGRPRFLRVRPAGQTETMTYPNFETLVLSQDGPLAIVTINREAQRNALSSQVMAEIALAAATL